MAHPEMITIMRRSWKIICLVAKKTRDQATGKKITETSIRILNPIATSKVVAKTIHMTTPISHPPIRNRTTRATLGTFASKSSPSTSTRLPATPAKMSVGAKVRLPTLEHPIITLILQSSSNSSSLNASRKNMNSLNSIMTKRKGASNKSIDKIKSILLSMILQIWDHAESAVENSILTV